MTDSSQLIEYIFLPKNILMDSVCEKNVGHEYVSKLHNWMVRSLLLPQIQDGLNSESINWLIDEGQGKRSCQHAGSRRSRGGMKL